MRDLRPRELEAHLQRATEVPLLLDVREPWEFEICHLEGSRLVPMRQIPAALPTLDRQRETVVVCHHGIRSRQVAIYLEQIGFTRVINLGGGVDAWAREVDQGMAIY
jgi:rhodanese-related sulfurtransferase